MNNEIESLFEEEKTVKKEKTKKEKTKKIKDKKEKKKINLNIFKKKSNEIKEKKSKEKKYMIFLIVLDIFAVICFFMAYGPISAFRDWLVSTALSSMDHDYFAYVLYSPEYVKKIAANNVVVETGESTDTNKITITEIVDTGEYESVYEEQILKKDEGNDLYKIIPISGTRWKGNIVVVYDPSRISVSLAKNLSAGGQYTSKIAKNTEAAIAINGGGFQRIGSSLRPQGTYIQDGKLLYTGSSSGRIIGFNKDNKLVLTRTNSKNALEMGIRDCVDFGPFLIVNGKVSSISGNGGYGYRPRTAIGQRQDGIVLMIVIDGKSGLGGIGMEDLTDIFVRYKAYNAANLDGGGSSTLVVKGKLYNNPRGWDYTGERYVPNAFIITKPNAAKKSN